MSGPSSDESGRRLYNPYKGLNRNVSVQTHVQTLNLYSLPTSPEFLFQEESIRRRRSWGENLTFYTGTSYLAGASLGAAYGLASAPRSFESSDTLKLKVNRVLNSSGHAGRKWGNRVGILGLMYAGAECAIDAVGTQMGRICGVLSGQGCPPGFFIGPQVGLGPQRWRELLAERSPWSGGKRVLRQYAGV